MPATHDDQLIIDIIKWLIREGRKGVRASGRQETMIFDYIDRHYPLVSSAESFEAEMKAKMHAGISIWDALSEKYFVLPIPDGRDKSLPLMSVKLGGNCSGVLAGLFLLRPWTGDKPSSIGFRSEEPHGRGKHNYFHAQFIHEIELNGGLPAFTMRLPTKAPAFPLFAKDKFELLMSSIMSIYGKDFIKMKMAAGLGNNLFNRKVGEWAPAN